MVSCTIIPMAMEGIFRAYWWVVRGEHMNRLSLLQNRAYTDGMAKTSNRWNNNTQSVALSKSTMPLFRKRWSCGACIIDCYTESCGQLPSRCSPNPLQYDPRRTGCKICLQHRDIVGHIKQCKRGFGLGATKSTMQKATKQQPLGLLKQYFKPSKTAGWEVKREIATPNVQPDLVLWPTSNQHAVMIRIVVSWQDATNKVVKTKKAVIPQPCYQSRGARLDCKSASS